VGVRFVFGGLVKFLNFNHGGGGVGG